MDTEIASADGTRLSAHLAASNVATSRSGVVLCHGFPTGPRGATASASTFPELADRIARETGRSALTFNFRGTGGSAGDFSAQGWISDIRGAMDVLTDTTRGASVVLVGVSEGGTFAVHMAGSESRVDAIATLAAPSSFRELARDPARVLEHARTVGTVRTDGFPPSVAEWGRDLASVDAVVAAARLGPRPLLVLHGSDDVVVAPADARALAEAAPQGELKVVPAAGHELRHDPRAIAALLGWLERLP